MNDYDYELECLSNYRLHLRRTGRSESTIKQRVGDIVRLRQRSGELLKLTKSSLTKYLDEHTEHWSVAYRKKVYISYRLFFQWAKKNRLIDTNPTKKLPQVVVPRYLPKPAPEEVVLSAFETATLAESAMLCLGSTQGLRRSEIASAHPKNRDGHDLRVVGKNSKERIVPLDSLTYTMLLQLESEQGTDSYYFPGRFEGHIHPCTVYKWLKRHLGTEWSTHNLRHRAASNGLRETKNLRGVQDLLGHESLDSTQIYTAVTIEDLKYIVDANSLQAKLVERRLHQFFTTNRHSSESTQQDSAVVEALQILSVFLQGRAVENTLA